MGVIDTGTRFTNTHKDQFDTPREYTSPPSLRYEYVLFHVLITQDKPNYVKHVSGRLRGLQLLTSLPAPTKCHWTSTNKPFNRLSTLGRNSMKFGLVRNTKGKSRQALQ